MTSRHVPHSMLRAGFVASAVVLGALAAAAARADPASPVSADSTQPATRAYDIIDFEWIDAERNRTVPARLYWPHPAQASTQVPLIVFSHGIGGSRRGYSYLGSHWASNGYASLHVQHAGSDRALWLGNPFSLVSRLHDAAQDREAIDRVRDLRFALDRVLGEPRLNVDRDRIVAAGHSYGANTTLLASGARVERNGSVLDFRDPRIKAAVIISAPPFYGEREPGKILRHVTVPTLHVTATEDVIRIPGYVSGAEDRFAVFDAVGSARKALAVFSGGSHSMFTDRAGTGGAVLNPQVKAATKALSLAFLRNIFEGDATGLQGWGEQHRDILARYELRMR